MTGKIFVPEKEGKRCERVREKERKKREQREIYMDIIDFCGDKRGRGREIKVRY